MGKGIDCATPLTAELAKEFKADGYDFVARYTVPEGSWKALTAEEVANIVDAGLYIVSIFETTANRALKGAKAGMYDAEVAVGICKGFGQPAGTPIYFAVDFDAQGNQYAPIVDYFMAAKEVLTGHGYTIGGYGSYSVIEMLAAKGIPFLWQTFAWSHGQRSAKAQLFQYKIDTVENGIGVDYNVSNGAAGGWMPVVEAPAPVTLDTALANEIIKELGEAWEATKSQAIKDSLHVIANKVRELAGIKEG